ncbi:MAG TPA: hypothetical protein VIV11_13170 [Kofleriaceae bacterium]
MRWMVVLGLVACNQFYGLEETVAIDDDRDDDGLLDVIDNCVEIANPLQENLDDDALGDICDPCPTGSNHNEDGDALLDGCDNCPDTPNDDQANEDGDEIGNACDRDPRPQRRVRFDPFESLGLNWIPGNIDWVVEDDAIRPLTPPNPLDPGLWDRRSQAAGTSYFITVTIDVDEVDNVRSGLWTRQATAGTEHQCFVERLGGAWTLTIATDLPPGGMQTMPTVVTHPLVLRLRRDGNLLHCETETARATIDIPDPVTYPGLYTSGTSRYWAVDIATSDP